MTPKKIIDANKAIQELSAVVLPYSAARAVANLKRRLKEETDIICGIERGIIAKYGGDIDDTGKCKFSDAESAKAFLAEQTEIMNQEDDIHLPEVDLSAYIVNINISAATLEALDGIVKFEEDIPNG